MMTFVKALSCVCVCVCMFGECVCVGGGGGEGMGSILNCEWVFHTTLIHPSMKQCYMYIYVTVHVCTMQINVPC